MEEEDLKDDQEVDVLYETFANLATDLSLRHNALGYCGSNECGSNEYL